MKRLEIQDIIQEILPEISFFGGANEEEISQIMEYVYEENIDEGKYIYKEGDPPGDMYILLEGELEFFILDEKIASGVKGILFGMSAAIGIQKQLVAARAKTDIRLAVISKKLFMTMCEKNPKLFGKIILNIARDLARDLNFLKEYVEETKKRCEIN